MYALLEYYAEESGNSLPTFRENLSVPSSRFEKSQKNSGLTILYCVIFRSVRFQKGADLTVI